jgi:NADP-dependent 3-hydroxy acid dehydrogenase YdfG
LVNHIQIKELLRLLVYGWPLQDLNFWGAVYPTYFALPYLKASRGNIVVTASVAGRVPTARMSFYNVSSLLILSLNLRT